MIGLKRNNVKLVSYNKKWITLFNETKDQIENLISEYIIDIQHVGSTAIVGIKKAKPIIDIAILIKDFNNWNEIQSILEENNFEYRGDSLDIGDRLFVKNKSHNIRTHHIHFIQEDDPQWGNYILFRDSLNSDKALTNEYCKLKSKLLALYSNNRDLYTKNKNTFITNVLNRDKS